MSGDYILATPVLNEKKHLPGLLHSLQGQTRRPALWYVVDDGSDDGSWEWLLQATSSHPWLKVGRAPESGSEYLGAHIARLKRWATEQAIALTERKGIAVAYVGLLDADLVLPPDHYERLIEALEADPQLGIVSSQICVERDGRLIAERQRKDLPRGGTQFFRRACLDAIGGIPPYPGYDGAGNVKAKTRGFKTRLITKVKVKHGRPTATRFGVASGYARKGYYAWFLGQHPLMVFGRAVYLTLHRPHSGGLHFLRGWLRAALRGGERCPDPEVRAYYGSWKPRALRR